MSTVTTSGSVWETDLRREVCAANPESAVEEDECEWVVDMTGREG
jgi:hypothetical protein